MHILHMTKNSHDLTRVLDSPAGGACIARGVHSIQSPPCHLVGVDIVVYTRIYAFLAMLEYLLYVVLYTDLGARL